MTLIAGPCATRSCCHNGQLFSSKSKRLEVNRNRRKNSNLVSSCPCFENGSNSNFKIFTSMWKSCSNLKRDVSSEKEFEVAQAKKRNNWCDCRDIPIPKVESKKVESKQIVCLPPCNKKTICRGKNVCIRRVPIFPKNELKNSCAPLDEDTTYKIDYPAKQAKPPKPIKHISTLITLSDPMNSETTYRNSYQVKPYSKRKGIYPINETIKSHEPMQGETITMSDFKVPRGFVPSLSIRPDNRFHPSLQPFDDRTTHKTDYVVWNTRGPVGPYPWTPGNKYESPVDPIYGDTTYKTSYGYPGYNGRPEPIIPKEQGIGIAGSAFDDSTTYKNDYQPYLILNERDCYDVNGLEICCESPCNPAKQRPCYKVNEPKDMQPKVMNTPIRKHSLPILCC